MRRCGTATSLYQEVPTLRGWIGAGIPAAMSRNRAAFVFARTMAVLLTLLFSLWAAADSPTTAPAPARHLPFMVEADGTLRLSFGEETRVIAGGLQPSLLCT